MSACSGGTGFSSNNQPSVDFIVFSGSSGQATDFFVSPTAGVPALLVTAQAEHGSGVAAVVVPDQAFTWAARYATAADLPSVNTYTVGPTPSGFKTCGFLAATAPTPPVPIYVGSGETLTPLSTGESASQIYIGAVPTVPPPYCLVLNATASNGRIGHATVVVSNSP